MRLSKLKINDLAGIQYLGHGGTTSSCLKAITRLISSGEELRKAYLLTNDNCHAFLLENEYEELIAIKSGFSSGYAGEGPKGLEKALRILERHKVEIEEYLVDTALLERLDNSCLLHADIDLVKNQHPIRPVQWYEYVYAYESLKGMQKNQLASYYPLSMPFGLIDERIIDLAIEFYINNDAAIISAFRRLEDILRKRTGLSGEGAKLFSKVYLAEDCPLHWDVPDDGESKGRANIFIATYMAFRNARVHRETESSFEEALREFLLVNELYKLEAESLTQAELQDKRAEEQALQESIRLIEESDG